jgi:hypothetical protein
MDSEFLDRAGNDGPAARYANYFEIGHNAGEFILDFGQAYASAGERQVHTRIVTSPAYARAFLRVLENAIERHEQAYGAIREE